MRTGLRLMALVCAAISLFFVFYTVRLFAVTHGLRQVRVGGQGAYIGAVAFPVLAFALGWASVRAWRRASMRD